MFHEQHLNWRDMEHPTISQQLERLDGGVNSALRIIPAPKSDRYQEISCGTRKVRWGLSGPVVWRLSCLGRWLPCSGTWLARRGLCGMPVLAVKVEDSTWHRSVDLWESQRSGKQTRRERRDAKTGDSAPGAHPLRRRGINCNCPACLTISRRPLCYLTSALQGQYSCSRTDLGEQ